MMEVWDENDFLCTDTGLSKSHFDMHVFLLKFVLVKYTWVHVSAREVFKTVKLLLASF